LTPTHLSCIAQYAGAGAGAGGRGVGAAGAEDVKGGLPLRSVDLAILPGDLSKSIYSETMITMTRRRRREEQQQ
jgi:hypothetical protein